METTTNETAPHSQIRQFISSVILELYENADAYDRETIEEVFGVEPEQPPSEYAEHYLDMSRGS